MACLLPQFANAFLDGLKKGEIDPKKLSEMTSEQRREFLGKYVGNENAKFVNAQFESKLLLKNQKAGLITWAKAISGLKPKAKNDLITRIEKLDKALDPETQQQFLADIVEQRLGVQVTAEEAKTITDLTAKLKENYANRFAQGNPYGKYKQELVEFMRDHTPERKYPTVLDMAKSYAAEGVSFARAIKTGLDFSASLRQGASYFGRKQWNEAFVRMFGYAKSKTALDELEASMYGNKYSDQAMEVKRDLGLTMLGESFTQREEQFASDLLRKVPLLRGSERAYEGFLNDLRFNRFVDVMEELDKAGNGITGNKKAMKDLAKVIAASTGRGELGSWEQAAKGLSTVLFSPRYLTSRFQLLLNPLAKSGPAKAEAAKSLATMAGLAVSLIGLAKMAGGNVEDDPRSSAFGKIKIGNTSFDLTFGMGPYIVAMTKLIRGQSKSATTGKVGELNSGVFGAQTRLDVATSFIENKTSPIARIILDYLNGETINGDKLNTKIPIQDHAKYLADQMLTPLLLSDTVGAFTSASGDSKIATGASAGVASLFGVGVSTRVNAPSGSGWDKLKSKSAAIYKEAVGEYNKRLDVKLEELKKTEDYNKAAETPQQNKKKNRADMIDKVKEKVSRNVVNEFSQKR